MAENVIARHVPIQIKLIEQRRPRFLFRSQHCQIPHNTGIESVVHDAIKEEFFNRIGGELPCGCNWSDLMGCKLTTGNVLASRIGL
jgi:hypothetical protein